jgi:DNA polymerase-3 subunit epsilon
MAFIDIETTGLNSTKDRIIELGLVVLKPDGTRTTWSSRFNPGMPIPPETTEIHRITDSDVADAPLFRDWTAQLHRELHGKDLAGYNPRRLDLPILDEEFRPAVSRVFRQAKLNSNRT